MAKKEITNDEFFMEVYRLKNLNRYVNWNRVKDETVAEHSYFVVLFTDLICTELDVCQSVRTKALRMGMIHDLPEIELSDIPHPVKAKNKGLKMVLNELEIDFMEHYFENVLYKDYLIEYNCMDTPESLIVQMADVLSVLQYCISEKQLGNKTMSGIYEDTVKRAELINNKIESVFGKRVKKFGKF